MGKVGGSSWLNAVKKAFRSPSKEKRSEEHHQDEDEKKRGSKSRWIFRKTLFRETTIQHNNEETDNTNAISETVNHHAILARNSACYSTNTNSINEAVEVEKRCTIAAALATAAAAEATQAVMEVIRLTNTNRIPISAMRIMREHLHFAAIMIQTAFRGYLARKALKALKGLVKLQALVRGHNVRERTKMTLQCMQSMVRVQTQLCDQRSRRLSNSSGTGAGLKETRNSISREVEYNYFRGDYQEMGEEIPTLEGCMNCKRRLGFPISEELPHENSTFESERTSYEKIKTIRVDNSESHSFSPSKSIDRRKSLSKPSHYNYPKPVTPTKSVAHPNYMSDTASAKARIRTQSAPRMRPMTPEREHNSRVAKRRMSGQVQELRYNSDIDDSEFVADYNYQISLPRSSHVRAWLR